MFPPSTAARLPSPATNISTSVTTTTANITFTIPAIAYTPEQYYIEYIGEELQNELSTSNIVNGENNITITNQKYTITLTGLEEANTYNFTVVSENCLGTTRVPIDTFTTDAAGIWLLCY